MALPLTDVRRIGSNIVQQRRLSLDVIGVTAREASSTSAKVILAIRDCHVERDRVVIGAAHCNQEE